jgi:hypothetical protein
MTRFMALVLGVVLFAGCAGPTYSYSKAGSNVADFRQDSYACVQEPRMSWGAGGNPMIVGTSTDAKQEAILYRMCMEARGWTAEASR